MNTVLIESDAAAGAEKQLSDATAQIEALKAQLEEMSSGAGAHSKQAEEAAAAAARVHDEDQAKILALTEELDKARGDSEEVAKQQGEAKMEVERLNAELVTSVAG
jgi:chromosome segregation ATPase